MHAWNECLSAGSCIMKKVRFTDNHYLYRILYGLRC